VAAAAWDEQSLWQRRQGPFVVRPVPVPVPVLVAAASEWLGRPHRRRMAAWRLIERKGKEKGKRKGKMMNVTSLSQLHHCKPPHPHH